MVKRSLLSMAASMLLISSLQAQSLVYDALLNVGTYKVTGSFGPYDFAPTGDNNPFDWAFTTTQGSVYQLQGKAPSDDDVFGWKPVTIDAPEAAWLMFPISDTDGDGKATFDWVMVQPQDNGAVYKLAGVKDGSFAYSDKINIPYIIDGDHVIFSNESQTTETADNFKFTTDYLNAKTLTFLAYDDHGTGNYRWRYIDYTFNETTVTLSADASDDEEAFSMSIPYEITDDGKISYALSHHEDEEPESRTITAFTQEQKYFKVCEVRPGDACDDIKQLLFLNHSDAIAFMNERNAQTLSKELLSNQEWYQVALGHHEQFCEMKLSLQEDGTGTLFYTDDDDKKVSAALNYTISNAKELTMSIPEMNKEDTMTFITQESNGVLNWMGSSSDNDKDKMIIKWFKNIDDVTTFLISQGNKNPQECTKWF
jgi:hypothetical protein